MNCVIIVSHTHGSEKLDIVAGGAEIQVQKLISFFNTFEKVKIHLITHFTKFQSKNGFQVSKIGSPRLPFLIAMILFMLKTCYLLAKLNKKENIDIIYSHMIGFACPPTIFAQRVLGIPSLSKVSGKNTKVREEKSSIHILNRILKAIILLLRYSFIKNLDFFQVLNTDLKKELFDVYNVNPEKVYQIPNGIEFMLPFSEKKIKSISTFGFVGRLEPVKNIPILLEAFEQMLKRTSDKASLVIYGIGSQMEHIREFIEQKGLENNIILKGFEKNMDRIYNNIDCFILPSKSEGVNNSLLEAISYGIPVIVSDIPSNRELIEHRKSGLLFDYNSATQLSNYMEKLMNNIELAQKLAKKAYYDSKKRFSMNSIGKRILKVFFKVIRS